MITPNATKSRVEILSRRRGKFCCPACYRRCGEYHIIQQHQAKIAKPLDAPKVTEQVKVRYT